ncbi:YdgH/BhsA/McbA-like domain containing protein [Pantoea agglomerans]|jgi:multiple stress resistance protein BhsA|uniref:multiple stress resistance protein BhsA n=1 Tax=Enterobacter agglomerans TaxID=549 RepID=UPI00278A66D3|nr:YdgH/BhsA/McbA-like domain containing protein [Pantoea agglomerans]MDQ0628956.1 multiple stress resistance protein BhsA [Pantoea agglomerans]
MKNINMMVVAAVLSGLSFASVAAQQVSSTPLDQHKIGVISATGSTNLLSLEQQLSEKASDAGAKSFRITSTSGSNNLHGTAVLYR